MHLPASQVASKSWVSEAFPSSAIGDFAAHLHLGYCETHKFSAWKNNCAIGAQTPTAMMLPQQSIWCGNHEQSLVVLHSLVRLGNTGGDLSQAGLLTLQGCKPHGPVRAAFVVHRLLPAKQRDIAGLFAAAYLAG